MPSPVFAAEYEGAWTSSADAMFPVELLRRQGAELDLPALSALRGPARLLGGVDWGEVNDGTAAVAIARLPASTWNPEGCPPDLPVFVAWPARVFDAGTQLSHCVDEIVSSPASWLWLAVESTGLGAMPASGDGCAGIRDRRNGQDFCTNADVEGTFPGSGAARGGVPLRSGGERPP